MPQGQRSADELAGRGRYVGTGRGVISSVARQPSRSLRRVRSRGLLDPSVTYVLRDDGREGRGILGQAGAVKHLVFPEIVIDVDQELNRAPRADPALADHGDASAWLGESMQNGQGRCGQIAVPLERRDVWTAHDRSPERGDNAVTTAGSYPCHVLRRGHCEVRASRFEAISGYHLLGSHRRC